MFKKKKKWKTLKLLMRGEEEAIVEDSFDKIQGQDDNEEEEVSSL